MDRDPQNHRFHETFIRNPTPVFYYCNRRLDNEHHHPRHGYLDVFKVLCLNEKPWRRRLMNIIVGYVILSWTIIKTQQFV